MEVIKDYLSPSMVDMFEEIFRSYRFPYYIQRMVSDPDIESENYLFVHNLVRDGAVTSEHAETILTPIMNQVPHQSVYRAKVNCYPRTGEIYKHGFHVDMYDAPENMNVLLFYVNTNNGYTEFESGEIIKSERNKAIIFDGDHRHTSTTCTDSHLRLNVNINFMK